MFGLDFIQYVILYDVGEKYKEEWLQIGGLLVPL